MPAEEEEVPPSEEEYSRKPQTGKSEGRNKNRDTCDDPSTRRCYTYPDGRILSSASARNLELSMGKRNCKSACLTETMVKEIRIKADVRAQRTDDPGNRERLVHFKEHRVRVKTAKAIVDSSSPFAPKVFYRNSNFNSRIANFARIERDNTIMLRHLAEIIHGKGLVDNRLKRSTYTNNRGQVRQMKLLRITFDNLSLLKRIQSQKPFYSRKKQLEEYRKMEQAMKHISYYPLYWKLKSECQWGPYEAKAKENATYRPRPKVFIALGNSTEYYGKVVIELFASECPMTAENFRGLCTGEYGFSYKCSTIHKVIPDILWQGGNLNSHGVTGSKSVYGESFPDENFKIKHDKPGILTMANWGPNTNGSQFIITAKKLAVLDGINVAFGRVVSGFNCLSQLCNKLTPTGKPKKKFFIVDCGETESDGEDEYPEEDDEEEENYYQESDTEPTDNKTISEPATYVSDTENDDKHDRRVTMSAEKLLDDDVYNEEEEEQR